MTEPVWDPSKSDGCSFPWWLDWLFPFDAKTCDCCLKHDEAYFYGGTDAERLAADNALRVCFILHGTSGAVARMAWVVVRLRGNDYWGWGNRPWGYGWRTK